MKRILIRERFPVLCLSLLLLAFAGCQKKAQGPHHFIRLRAQDGISKPQFDTALMVLDQRLRGAYDGDVTVRAEGKTIILEVAGRPNLDSLAVLVLSRGGFGMYEMYTNDAVTAPERSAELVYAMAIAPGSIELAYALARDTARIRAQYVESNRSLYNVLFAWGAEDQFHQHAYPLYALKRAPGNKPLITKKMISTAIQGFDQSGRASVTVQLKETYVMTWLNATRSNVGRHIAIRFSNQVLSAPQVLSEIPGGNMEISGGFKPLQAKMLAAMIATPDLEPALKIEHIDTALFVPLRGYPTLKQQARYEVIHEEFLQLRPQIDSLLSGSSMEEQTARQEMERIYRQDINTITAETHATRAEVDEFIVKMEAVLTGLKNRLNGEANETTLKEMLEVSPAQ